MKCADVNGRYSLLPVHEKILLVDKEKPGIATWLFCIIFHFSAIIFHVDICESYATLDTAKGKNREQCSLIKQMILAVLFCAPGEIVPMGYFFDSGIMLQLK